MTTAYISDDQVRTYVFKLFVNHPNMLAVLGGLCVMWLKYSPAHSPIGILQEVPAARATLVKQGVSLEEKPSM
jgi:hypothetical protein